MNKVEQYFIQAKGNRWFHYFAVFCRVALALGFMISGKVKILGERFAAGLPVNNPMGHYLEALYHTEYYYTFIGISQVIIALLLLLPRTAFLGALMYFPVILNICILAHAVRFEGTRITTFMVLANLYLLCWDYERVKQLVFYKPVKEKEDTATPHKLSRQFPYLFFGSAIATLAAVVVINLYMYDIRPGNSMEECGNGCPGNMNPKACEAFCDCLYNKGKTFDTCLDEYNDKRHVDK